MWLPAFVLCHAPKKSQNTIIPTSAMSSARLCSSCWKGSCSDALGHPPATSEGLGARSLGRSTLPPAWPGLASQISSWGLVWDQCQGRAGAGLAVGRRRMRRKAVCACVCTHVCVCVCKGALVERRGAAAWRDRQTELGWQPPALLLWCSLL